MRQSLIAVPRNKRFEVNDSGTTIGRIHWRVESRRFPSADWDDFIVVILSWWLAVTRRYLRNRTKQRLLFMDGPYEVLLTPRSPTTCNLAFCRRGAADRPVAAFVHIARDAALAASVISAAETTLAKRKRMAPADPEIANLELELRKLASSLVRKGSRDSQAPASPSGRRVRRSS